MTNFSPDKAYALILVYDTRIDLPLVRVDEAWERGVTSMSYPMHALTRTGAGERAAWTTFKEDYPIRIEEMTRDELEPFIRSQLERQIAQLPHPPTDKSSVLVRTSGSIHRLLMTFPQLSKCEGNLDDFRQALFQGIQRYNLTFIERSSPHQVRPDETKKRA